jgi:alpha-tubulin suppressor-like RCC1 family protein
MCESPRFSGPLLDNHVRAVATVVSILIFSSAHVEAAQLATITVEPANSYVALGKIQAFVATGLFAASGGATARISNDTLASGGDHSCAIVRDGYVRCWGRNGFGQLGNLSTADSPIPVQASLITNAVGVAVGSDYSCALQADGVVRCWGHNDFGQLGTGGGNSTQPVVVTGLDAGSVAAIGAGFRHSCAVLASGAVKCWGDNSSGQLGNGTLTASPTPIDVSTIATATAIAVGGSHTCALLANATVQCWGANYAGQLGTGTLSPSSSPVAVAGIDNAVAIAAGFDHNCAVIAGGNLKCWGRGVEGQLGNAGVQNSSTPVDVLLNSNRVVAVRGGLQHTCAVLEIGIVECWGNDGNGQLGNGLVLGTFSSPVTVGSVSDSIAISTGYRHSCAVLGDGEARCWGLNDGGQLGNGSAVQRSGTAVAVNGAAAAISAGGNSTCAFTPTGAIACWGYNFYGMLGNGSRADSAKPVNVTGIDHALVLALGFDHACATTSFVNGGAGPDLWCWGRGDSGQLGVGDPTSLPDCSGFRCSSTPLKVTLATGTAGGVAAGSAHTCVRVISPSSVECWGANNRGQLGNGTNSPASTPVAIGSLSNVREVTSGFEHSCALLDSGAVRCWGRGDEGELGNGSTADSLTPVAVSGIGNATSISAGNFHTCARLLGGTVQCWGRGDEGQLGNANILDSSTPVAVNGIATATSVTGGGFHSCASLSSGALRCWGRNDFGQLGAGFTGNASIPVDVVGISTAVAVDAGRSHTCAVLAEGGSRCWGYNDFGQVGGLTAGNTSAPAVVTGIAMDAVALEWTSSNPVVATIDMSGHARARATGSATITARYGGVSAATTFSTATDTDGDGVPDPIDNCVTRANSDQRDSNHDGYGNACDPDLDDNGVVNFADLAIFRARFGTNDANADFNGDGVVNFADLAIFRSFFGLPPGPTGVHP